MPVLLSPYLYAVIEVLMVVAMGNLTTMFASHTGDPLEGNGFKFCFACNGGQGYDWFGASRIIQDYRTVNGQKQAVGFPTINEFPAFFFVLADLHPHREQGTSAYVWHLFDRLDDLRPLLRP